MKYTNFINLTFCVLISFNLFGNPSYGDSLRIQIEQEDNDSLKAILYADLIISLGDNDNKQLHSTYLEAKPYLEKYPKLYFQSSVYNAWGRCNQEV